MALVKPEPIKVAGLMPGIHLEWTDLSDTEDAYRVERSPNGSTGWVVLTGSLPANTESYVDSTANPGETWHYRVAASFFGVPGPYSDVVSGAAIGPVAAPDRVPAVQHSARSRRIRR